MYNLDGFSVNHNVIFFPVLDPRKCYQGLSRSCQNYRIILAGYTTTTTPTAITPLLFPLCITSTVIQFLLFFPSPPPPLPSHFYCFLPPPPPPPSHFYCFPLPHWHHISIVFSLHHLHRHRISIREIKTSTAWMYSSAERRDSSQKKEVTGAPYTTSHGFLWSSGHDVFLPHPL